MTKEQFALAAEGAGFIPAVPMWFRHPNIQNLLISPYNEEKMIVTLDITRGQEIILPLSLQRLTHLFKAFQV
jgi:hypothetical protein